VQIYAPAQKRTVGGRNGPAWIADHGQATQRARPVAAITSDFAPTRYVRILQKM
jgi:hypothetical protein